MAVVVVFVVFACSLPAAKLDGTVAVVVVFVVFVVVIFVECFRDCEKY